VEADGPAEELGSPDDDRFENWTMSDGCSVGRIGGYEPVCGKSTCVQGLAVL
jgi:hypothetical protein